MDTSHTSARSSSVIPRLSLMMFLQFFIWGGFFVTMGSYMLQLFGKEENINTIIGQAYATQTWAGLIAPLFVGLIADRFFNAEKVNAICHILGAGVLWYASTVTEPSTFIWTMFLYFMLYMPTLALVNAIAFSNIESAEKQFPAIRVWGTIGWIASGFIVAQTVLGFVEIPLIKAITGVENAQKTAIPLQMCAIVSAIYGIYSFTLPACKPGAKGTPMNIGKALGFDALQLFAKPGFAVFAICSFLVCIPLAFYYARTNDFISAMAFGEKSASYMTIGQISEIGFMLLVPFFLAQLGVKKMLLVGMLAWTLRYALFAWFPESTAMLLLGVALHGICYDFFFVTGQLYTDRVAPKEIRASAQALIGLLTYGAGMLVGNIVLGAWGDRLALDGTTKEGWLADAAQFWGMPAAAALAVAIVFFLSFREPARTEQN
ncbi:MAG: MFS transporter [Verrucomicrobiales bacterium]